MIKRWLFSLSLLLPLLMAPALPVAATDLFSSDQNCTGTAAKSAVCNSQTSSDPLIGSDGIILKVTNIVAYIAGAAAIILAVVSGIRFMTAGGNAEKATEARKTLTGALIGVAVIVLGRTLIAFVVDRL